MLNIRVGHDHHTYYVGFEPPLDAEQLAALPNPYNNGGAVETAGWPRSAVVSNEKDPATVLGIYKASLKVAPVVQISFSSPRRMEYAKSPPPESESLLKFLSDILKTFDDSVLDAKLHHVDTSNGVVDFVQPNDDSAYQLHPDKPPVV